MIPMRCSMEKKMTLFRYRGAIPAILAYQLVSKLVFFAVMWLYRQLTGLLLWNLDRPAFTSGDLPYLLRSWQGWLLILCGFLALLIYTVFDVNATILLSNKVLRDERIRALPLLREALLKMRRFGSTHGLLVILYVTLLAPLAGAAFGVSLTTDFTVPEFIVQFINESAVLHILYSIAILILGIVGIVYLFTFHFVLLRDNDARTAMRSARKLMRGNWKAFLKNYLLFLLKALMIFAAILAAAYILPLVLSGLFVKGEYAYHVLVIFFTGLWGLAVLVYAALFLQFQMMELTVLFDRFTEAEPDYIPPGKKRHYAVYSGAGAVLVLLLAVSLLAAVDFDTAFPAFSDVKVIAHRGGGTLGNENTVLSLERAIEHGASATEIDVQRTADGYYIINHDTTFERCCGVDKRPGEMTLAEIKTLEVVNAQDPLAPTAEVATMEEILDAAKGHLTVYIELKGESADHQMADDIYRMIVERGMQDECMFISLSYELIDYIETTYPEMRTGYLCYFSFGNIGDMNCDALLLEAETATQANVDKIHTAGKEVNVWTVNTLDGMTRFMTSDVDGIITDEVAQAELVRSILTERSDSARVLQYLYG